MVIKNTLYNKTFSYSKIVNMSETLTEALEELKELKTYVAEVKKKEAEATKEKAEAEAKKKAEAEAKEKAEAEAKRKGEAKHKQASKVEALLKAAYDQEKDDSVKERIAEIMKKAEMDDDDKDDKEDKEHEAMKAELIVLRGEVSKPKLQYLEAAFKERIPEAKLNEYKANWGKMTMSELDAEISRVEPFVGQINTQKPTMQTPVGFSTLSFSAKTEDDTFEAEIKKKSVADLFSGGIN